MGNDALPPHRDPALRRMGAVLVAVALIWLLRAADTVFLPLAFAVFLIGLFWPLQRRLLHRLPRAAATSITLVVFLLISGGFVWGSGGELIGGRGEGAAVRP